MKKKKLLLYYNDILYTPSELFLNKDFGQVATVLGRLHGLDVEYLISANKINPDLKIFSGGKVFQKKKFFNFLSNKFDFIRILNVYAYIISKWGTYDYLVLFPFVPASDYLFIFLFKIFNPKCRVICKLDANKNYLNYLSNLYKKYKGSWILFTKQVFFYKNILINSDLIMFETDSVGDILLNGFLDVELRLKVVSTYNGISDNYVKSLGIKIIPFNSRNNDIIFSGRLDAAQKNIEMIFRANPDIPGWRIKFLGDVTPSLKDMINKYKSKISNFDEKFYFLGLITDKREYFRIFAESKILLLTSNWEGFPMVFAEARYFGLYIITTNVSGSEEATRHGNCGMIVPLNDHEELKRSIEKICFDPDISRLVESAKIYSNNRFVWENSLMDPRIQSIMSNHSQK